MRKIIQPKRVNKNITVQEYWQIRDKQKQPKKQLPLQAFRQDQVARRFRYLKPTEQAKLFNPLNYFFKKTIQRPNDDKQYAEHFKDQEFTYTHEFLSSVSFRVSGPLIPIKKYIYGLKSIVYNHETILRTLLANLECEESWTLVQAIIKDTKGESFWFWMREGLRKLAYQDEVNKESIFANFFTQSKFQSLFDTLAVFMETNYELIMANLKEYFTLMNSLFFSHRNKYIRRFSMKSVSYIINNLSIQDNLNLIFDIVLNKSIQEKDPQNGHIPIGEILLYRHRTVKGCLSSVQINKFIQTLKQLPLFYQNTFQTMEDQQKQQTNNQFKSHLKNQVNQIMVSYIAGVLDMLETKFGRVDDSGASQEILFDLNYCIRALVALQQKTDSKISFLTVVKAFQRYLQVCDQKKFLTHNQKHQNYINETFNLILTYVQTSLIKQLQQPNFSIAQVANNVVSLIRHTFKHCPKETAKFLLSKGVVQCCKVLNEESALKLVEEMFRSEALSEFDQTQGKVLGEFLFLAFSKWIKAYFESNQSENINRENEQLLYTIYLITKRVGFNEAVSMSYLNMKESALSHKASQIKSIPDFILYSRLLALLQISHNDTFSHALLLTIRQAFYCIIEPFSQSLGQILSQQSNQEKGHILSYKSNVRRLLRYSHHEVQWVNIAVNLEECFEQVESLIEGGMQKKPQHEKVVWSQLCLNRPVSLKHDITLEQIFGCHLHLLQSRNRLTRFQLLQAITKLLDQSSQSSQLLRQILSRIELIDSDDIDLDNERDVKKEFVLLQQEISQIKLNSEELLEKNVIKVLCNWMLGFCFTGFKLMGESIVGFFGLLLDSFPTVVVDIVMPFVEYYIYRHSRQFEHDTVSNPQFVLRTPAKVQPQLQEIRQNEEFYQLIKSDFISHDQKTIEWIGLQRIGQGVHKARKFRNQQSGARDALKRTLDIYFNEQFRRKSNILSNWTLGDDKPQQKLILQPKTRFLLIMLQICPSTYLPPYQCLHYVSNQYLTLQSVSSIKKSKWQALWVKKLKGSKSREEISDVVNTTIQLSSMAMQEQELYVNFLWRQVLEADQHKRRMIFQHVRDRVPGVIEYLFERVLFRSVLCLKEGFFKGVTGKEMEESRVTQLKHRLSFQNKKSLLNLMYVIKAMIVVFKNYLRDEEKMAEVVMVVRAVVRLVYQREDKGEMIQEQREKGDEQLQGEKEEERQEQQQQQGQQQQQQQQQEQQREQLSTYSQLKPHRKQLYKLLTQLFTHHTIQHYQAAALLTQLNNSYLHNPRQKVANNSIMPAEDDISKFRNLALASINSVPGLLILLKVMSGEEYYRGLLMEFGVVGLVGSVVDIGQDKRQGDVHAVRVCLEVVYNMLGGDGRQQTIKQGQQQKRQHSHHHNTTITQHHNTIPHYTYLLHSICHHLLYSHSNQPTSTDLQYYTNSTKQNLNSINNSKNPLTKGNQQQQTRNVDLMWVITGRVVKLCGGVGLGVQWERVFFGEINKLVKLRTISNRSYSKLFNLLEIALAYFTQQLLAGQSYINPLSSKNQQSAPSSATKQLKQFLSKLISILPYIPELQQRVKFTSLIHCSLSQIITKTDLISPKAIEMVTQINSIKKQGLVIQIDYERFFKAIRTYSEEQAAYQMSLLSQQYFIYNLMPYIASEQLSVRKSVKQAINSFLVKVSQKLIKDLSSQSKAQSLKLINTVFRLLIEQLKRNQIDAVFWSIVGCIGLFVRFLAAHKEQLSLVFQNAMLYDKIMGQIVVVGQNQENISFQCESEEDFFNMVGSISQGNKMRALKMLKEKCIALKQQQPNIRAYFKQQQKGTCLPHPIPIFLSILQHMILPTKHFLNQHNYHIQGNLTSTLTHLSLQTYQVIMPFTRESLIKKQLKRLAKKIRFNQSNKTTSEGIKANILVIKIISSIVQGIDVLQKCTGRIRSYVKEQGFEQFHEKIVSNTRNINREQEEDQQEEEENEREEKKRVEFGENLQELESQQAINRNFMLFDRKLLTLQQKQNQQQQHNSTSSTALISFLKLHVLIPFKLMLFYQSKSSKQNKQEQDKSRMMISVAITKLLIKFPMDMFLFEFQKVLSKICRLLKKRKLQVRENGRKSLCQIAKIVGPEMLYAIVLQLKFHLRDNFQKHIFNYTVYQIIQSLQPLPHGSIDYCLPLILPMIIDQIFGQSSQQKKMVDANEVPTLNMQTKKKKGNELLVLISKQVSVERIRFMIEYLERFLKEYLNTEANLVRYETMVGNLINGLGQNEHFVDKMNAGLFGEMLCGSMYQLRKEIKMYNFQQEQNKLTHQTTLTSNTLKSKKVGKESLLLQQQTGRNGSIFKKMSKEVYQKRTKQILINSLLQFYLALCALLIKKQVICLKTLEENAHLQQNFMKIMQLVFQCMDHRDNRIVCKSMRLLHQALIINYEKSEAGELKQSMKGLRKKVSRKILGLVQKLTGSDAQLVKQSFTILIDLFTQVSITTQFLPSIVTIIKLHTNSQNQQSNIAEPYRLLKLIIYKLPQCIYNPLVYELYEFIRINMVNSGIREIREVCKSICLSYVRGREFLVTGVEMNLRKEENKGKKDKNKGKGHDVEVVYQDRIRKELNFLMSNLDCKNQENQLLVLEVLEEWIANRTKTELQDVAELIMLSLATALVNGNECITPIEKIMTQVLKTIDKQKTYDLLQKASVFISQPRDKTMIRQCGYLLISMILTTKSVQLQNTTVRSQYLLKQDNSFMNSLTTLLNQELDVLTDYLISKKEAQRRPKVSGQWGGVLEAIDVEEPNPYLEENRILGYCVDVIGQMAESAIYQEKLKQLGIVGQVWRLLRIPKSTICQKAVNFLSKVNNLAVHLASVQTSQQQDQDHNQEKNKPNQPQILRIKPTIATLINNQIPKQTIQLLVNKLLTQPIVGTVLYTQMLTLMLNQLNKLVTKFKLMEDKAQALYYLFDNCIIKDTDKFSQILKQDQYQTKIIDTLGKVSRNEFVTPECKVLNETVMGQIKELVGTTEFYKKLTQLQSLRREKKAEHKANLARLAVTDQKAYIDAKKKKVKTQNS